MFFIDSCSNYTKFLQLVYFISNTKEKEDEEKIANTPIRLKIWKISSHKFSGIIFTVSTNILNAKTYIILPTFKLS